jgi:hypothetical protein
MENIKLVKEIEKKFKKKFRESLLELREIENEMAVFDYAMYWDSYPEYRENLERETSFLLKEFTENKEDFNKPFFFHAGGFVIDHI